MCSCELSAGSASTHGTGSDFSCRVSSDSASVGAVALRADVATSDLGLTEVTLPPRVVEALGDAVDRWAAGPETGRFHVDRDFVRSNLIGPEVTVIIYC